MINIFKSIIIINSYLGNKYEIFFLFVVMLVGYNLHAQVPQAFNYQAVCRDTNGTPLAQQLVTCRASVLQGSPSGTVVYRETHTDTTNVYGISTLKIGRGTPVQGTFASIPWGSGSYYLSIEMDPAGGSNYRNLGAPELLSVPYALQSKDGIAKGTITNQLLYWNGTVWDTLNPGSSGQMLTMCNGNLIWGNCPGSITGLSCSTAVHSGQLIDGLIATSVSSRLAYTGGNGGHYAAQTIASTGVTGLTAIISGGYFVNGNDSVTINISGTPVGGGIASFSFILGGQSCMITRNIIPAASLNTLNCGNVVHTGNLEYNLVASGVSFRVPYNGGNGGFYSSQSFLSLGVTGLIASIPSGYLVNGNDSLTMIISGTPISSGVATFSISIGGQSCTVTRIVIGWRQGMVNCTSLTQIAPVINPITNKIWMDRNLGASQVANSSTDVSAYGDLFQWGRFADGHQCRNSGTSAILSMTDTPVNGLFITSSGDWRSIQNDNLWQGEMGINNPCPNGYRLPSSSELDAERLSWTSNSDTGAFSSPLKLTLGGRRYFNNGALDEEGWIGYYWSSSVSGDRSILLYLHYNNASLYTNSRVYGYSVRCIQD